MSCFIQSFCTPIAQTQSTAQQTLVTSSGPCKAGRKRTERLTVHFYVNVLGSGKSLKPCIKNVKSLQCEYRTAHSLLSLHDITELKQYLLEELMLDIAEMTQQLLEKWQLDIEKQMQLEKKGNTPIH